MSSGRARFATSSTRARSAMAGGTPDHAAIAVNVSSNLSTCSMLAIALDEALVTSAFRGTSGGSGERVASFATLEKRRIEDIAAPLRVNAYSFEPRSDASEGRRTAGPRVPRSKRIQLRTTSTRQAPHERAGQAESVRSERRQMGTTLGAVLVGSCMHPL